jgi:hypothetical protein
MSSDEIQRAQGAAYTTFFGFLFGFISPTTLATLIQYYCGMKDFVGRVWTQTCYSTKVLTNSFQDQYIRFYKIGSVFVPIHTWLSAQPPMMPGELLWVYNCTKKEFTELASAAVSLDIRKIPYIAATLTNRDGSETIADLSEWLVDVHTQSADAFVPPQVLVSAYAFDTNKIFTQNMNDLFLHCMTLSLDEAVFCVGTGTEVLVEEKEEPVSSETEI